jgi:hypothetical protein
VKKPVQSKFDSIGPQEISVDISGPIFDWQARHFYELNPGCKQQRVKQKR